MNLDFSLFPDVAELSPTLPTDSAVFASWRSYDRAKPHDDC
jgi:hypothetical protein